MQIIGAKKTFPAKPGDDRVFDGWSRGRGAPGVRTQTGPFGLSCHGRACPGHPRHKGGPLGARIATDLVSFFAAEELSWRGARVKPGHDDAVDLRSEY
jgi:hypothetical protein